MINGEGVPRVAPQTPVKAGGKITFAVQAEGMQFFDPVSEAAIWNWQMDTTAAGSPWWHGAVLYPSAANIA